MRPSSISSQAGLLSTVLYSLLGWPDWLMVQKQQVDAGSMCSRRQSNTEHCLQAWPACIAHEAVVAGFGGLKCRAVIVAALCELSGPGSDMLGAAVVVQRKMTQEVEECALRD